eukprot:2697839-Pleurochrysis_carterae.AAC.3
MKWNCSERLGWKRAFLLKSAEKDVAQGTQAAAPGCRSTGRPAGGSLAGCGIDPAAHIFPFRLIHVRVIHNGRGTRSSATAAAGAAAMAGAGAGADGSHNDLAQGREIVFDSTSF